MESQNYLGIYLSKNAATVVCLDSQGPGPSVKGCFSVSLEGQEQANFHTLAGLIAAGCAERGLQFSEVAVALDCAMFMQHNVHSEFGDPKRIAATVRFDTEEALAADISDIAIAFKIASGSDSGSELTVFTAQRKVLSELIGALQSHNIDPVAIEPDVNCLSRYIYQKVFMSSGSRALFAMLSKRRGYLTIPPLPAQTGVQKTSIMRTFLVGPAQPRNDLVTREVLMSTALTEAGSPINCLKIFDSNNSLDIQRLSGMVGLEVEPIDLTGAAVIDPQVLAGCADPVDFSIAYGSALAYLEKELLVNFRDDFMPYQGKKLQLQKTLKFATISVCVLLISAGLYFQAQLWRVNKDRSKLRARFAKEYSSVMLGDKMPDRTSPVEKLKSGLRYIRQVKSGLPSVSGEESISSKLTLVLQALNNCAAETNLDIESISITARNIVVTGNTSSRTSTLKLFDAVGKGGLEIVQQRLTPKGARDEFSITVEPKRQVRAGL